MRLFLTTAALGAVLLAPASADAAKVKIGGGSIRVDDKGAAAIKLTNPNRSAAKGTLTLSSSGARIGSSRFTIRARRSKKVKVKVVASDALARLAAGEDLAVVASAKTKGRGTTRKGLELVDPTPAGGPGAGAPGATGTPPAPGPAPAPVPFPDSIPDGTIYKGTTDQGEAFEFMKIVGGQVQPLSFHAHGTCFSTRDSSTSIITGHMLLPGNFPIGPDGGFSGNGEKNGRGSGPSVSMRYTFAGKITGDTAQGTFSLVWEELGFVTYPYVETWQVFCNREVTWTATRQ